MIAPTLFDAAQLTIGAVIGLAVSLNLDRYGMSLMDPKTRWTTLGIICTFLFTFLLFSEWLKEWVI